MKRSSFIALMLALLIAALPVNSLAGTASGSANTGAGGQTCAKVSKRGRDNTGAMTVGNVKLNGTDLKLNVDYKIRAGTNGSTRPVIEFTNPLPANAQVVVELSTIQDGTFTVIVELEKCRR